MTDTNVVRVKAVTSVVVKLVCKTMTSTGTNDVERYKQDWTQQLTQDIAATLIKKIWQCGTLDHVKPESFKG